LNIIWVQACPLEPLRVTFFLHFVDCVPKHVSYKHLDCIEVRILLLYIQSLAHSVERVSEKLVISALVKKFPAFYGTGKIHQRAHKSPPSQLNEPTSMNLILVL
jgi:hypothetical protein